jgi:hypothetical protein
MTDATYDYEGLKLLAKDLGRPVETLVAQSPQSDPFYANRPGRREAAEWFAALWERFDFQRGIHLRRIHYALVSQREPVELAEGKHYENTFECWQKLCVASRDARHLELVPADWWTDKKSASIIHLVEPTAADITLEEGELGSAMTEMPEPPRLELIPPTVAQPYHVELWCEKTTINDILLSLAEQYGLNVVTGEGELSVTACVQVVDRAIASGRPVRILYISDFDPAGQSMPLTVARKIEHLIYRRGLDLDIQVRVVALTREQVIEYEIPSIPLKETERRAADFHEQHGGLAAELDALEALHPGGLRRILVEEIERYCDPDLVAATEAAAEEFASELESITEAVHEEHREQLDELEEDWAEIATSIESWNEQAQSVWRAITNDLLDATPDPADHDWPEAREPDEDDDPLFDSTRDYVEQMDRYKQHQGKPITHSANTIWRQRKANGGGTS